MASVISPGGWWWWVVVVVMVGMVVVVAMVVIEGGREEGARMGVSENSLVVEVIVIQGWCRDNQKHICSVTTLTQPQ